MPSTDTCTTSYICISAAKLCKYKPTWLAIRVINCVLESLQR